MGFSMRAVSSPKDRACPCLFESKWAKASLIRAIVLSSARGKSIIKTYYSLCVKLVRQLFSVTVTE